MVIHKPHKENNTKKDVNESIFKSYKQQINYKNTIIKITKRDQSKFR